MNTEKLPAKTRILSVLKKTLLGIAGLVLLLYFAVWIFSPMVARWQLNKILNPLNLQLTENASIRLNPFLLKLSISDAELQRLETAHPVASLNHAEIDLNAFGLFFNELELEKFTFRDIEILALNDESMVEIAGFVFPASKEKQDDTQNDPTEIAAENLTAEEQSADEQLPEDKKPWQILAKTINLNDLTIRFTNHGYEHQVVLKALTLDNISMSESHQVITMQLQALLDDAPLSVDIQLNNQLKEGQLSLDFQLQQLALERFAYLAEDYLSDLSGKLSLDVSQQLTFNGADVNINIPSLNIVLDSLAFMYQKNRLTNEKFHWSFTEMQIESSADAKPKIETQFNLSNEKFSVTNAHADQLFHLGKLALQRGQLKLTDLQNPDATIDAIVLNDIILSKPSDNTQSEKPAQTHLPPIATIQQLALNQLALAQQHLSIASVQFDKLDAAVILDKNKNLANLVTLSEAKQQESPAEETLVEEADQSTDETVAEQSETRPGFTFNLAEFSVSPTSRLSFIDRSVAPSFEQSLELVEFKVADIDNRQPDNRTDLTVKLKTDAYAQTEIAGYILPFSDRMNLEIAASVKEFSLPKVSPYLKDAMGFEMLSGQFDTDTQVKITADVIDGEAKLFMRGLELSSSDDVDENSLKDQSAMPLNSALSMLMDDKGNLELDIPLSGNVSEPDFGVTGFVALVSQKAIMAAAQSYLVDSFIPYANVLSVVMMAGEAMLKVNIEDLVYPPTVIDVQPQHQVFIDEFAALLKDKPDTQVKVCAIAVPADLADKKLTANDPQFKQQLNLISQTRGEAFKAWLVEKAQIESARMLLCQPRIDSKADAKPRIEFEL